MLHETQLKPWDYMDFYPADIADGRNSTEFYGKVDYSNNFVINASNV